MATLSPSGTSWRLDLRLTVDGVQRQHRLEAPTCAALAKAAALIVAVSVDPVAVASTIENRSQQTAEVPPPPATAPRVAPPPALEPIPSAVAPVPESAATEPAPRVRRRRPVTGFVGVQAGLVGLTVPGVSGGPGISAGLTVGGFRTELRGRYVAPKRAQRDDVGAVIDLGTVSWLGCWSPQVETVAFVTCGGFEVGALRATGRGVDNRQTQRWPWAAAVLSGGLRWWVRERVSLSADLEVALPVVDAVVLAQRPGVGNALRVFETGRASVRPFVGVEVRFGGRPR